MESKLILVGRSSIPEDDERGYLGHDQVAINIASVGETIDEKVCQQRVGPCAVILVRETDSFLCVKQERTSLRSPGRFSSRYRRRRGGGRGDRQFARYRYSDSVETKLAYSLSGHYRPILYATDFCCLFGELFIDR